MKVRFILTLFAATTLMVSASVSVRAQAQTPAQAEYEFEDLKINPVTSVKDQASSGTCWSFATVAMLESELLRDGKGEFNLSEMWIVRNAYIEKAMNYVRMHGNANFGAGGVASDIPIVIDKYGLMPEEAYTGLNYGTDRHQHGEMDAALKAYVEAIAKSKRLTPVWLEGFTAILDAYLGVPPEKFTYNGREYTPESFAAELGLKGTDYIQVTSFTHHPFYETFVLEVPDNWSWESVYNVPMEELEPMIDHLLEQGYTISWASDVSESGFMFNQGFATVPAEKTITQQIRQQAFDDFETTDDHSMQIVGASRDQNGNKYYKVKNSWGSRGVYGGYFYASVPYVLYKSTALLVNKEALPKDMKARLDIH